MSRFFFVSSAIVSNCLFTLAMSFYLWGQFEDTQIEIGIPPARLHLDIDSCGVSFTRHCSTSSLVTIISRSSNANHWKYLFTLHSPGDWQNSAFAYDNSLKITLLGSGKRLIILAPERYGVRHWFLCLVSGGLFGLVHSRHLLVLWSLFSRFSRRSHDKRHHDESSPTSSP